MMHRNTATNTQPRSPISNFRTSLTTGFTAAALLAASFGAAHAQDTTPAPAPAQTTTPAATQTAPGANDTSFSNQKPAKASKKEDKIVPSKDTKKVDRKLKKDNPLLGQDPKLPDKALYDKAMDAMKHGRFDVARLDLQTLLNTYQDSQFMMRAKLAIADSWYKEGGTAALTQAEQEYKDFITFFPNAPEAAEAQMRVGDIYFREMDKPDRDYTTTVHAEQEYRLMLQQFPDSPLIPQAQQKLREVQEVLAARETRIAQFYGERQPPAYSAAIARFQTVADTYPLYSHMDDVLIGLGDAYAAQARYWRTLSTAKLPEAAKARVEAIKARLGKINEDAAQSAYTKVVLEHAAAPHVEDAKDRLTGMGLPVPTPTPEQLAASTALENSRGQYTLSKRVIGFVMHQADTVQAATTGAPPLEDPTPTNAATIVRKAIDDYQAALNPGASQAPAPAPAQAPAAADSPASAPATPPAALSLQEVPAATSGTSTGSAITTTVPQSSPSTSGSSMGIEIVRPDASAVAPTAPATPPAFPGTQTAKPEPENIGVAPVGPENATPLAPIEKPAVAPDPVNDAAGTKQPPAQTAPANGKKPKPALDKTDESSSKHKPKKGLGKLNPF